MNHWRLLVSWSFILVGVVGGSVLLIRATATILTYLRDGVLLPIGG